MSSTEHPTERRSDAGNGTMNDDAMEALRIMGNRAREDGSCDRCIAMSYAAEQVDAEVVRLSAELDEARAELAASDAVFAKVSASNAEVAAENAELRAKIKHVLDLNSKGSTYIHASVVHLLLAALGGGFSDNQEPARCEHGDTGPHVFMTAGWGRIECPGPSAGSSEQASDE